MSGSDTPQLLFDLCYRAPKRPSEIAPVPADVEQVIAIAMAKRPIDRFANVDELAAAFRDATGDRLEPAVRRKASTLLDGLAGEQGALDVWMSHGDRVTKAPPGYAVVGSTDSVPIAAIANAGTSTR